MASIVDNSNEESVQLTADDALVSKQSAANLGYFNDRFLSCFVKRPSKRSPLINRGYYARVAAIQTLIVKFLEKCWDLDLVPQVVSLGGGFDTTFFRIKDEGLLKGDITYVEVDFPEICYKKAAVIRSNSILRAAIGNEISNPQKCAGEIHSMQYHLAPVDLRDTNQLGKALESSKVDFSQPIFYLSECVLVYMNPNDSARVISWAAQKANVEGGGAVFVTYEQIRPNDAFGKVMMENLRNRGCDLKGIEAHPDQESQKQRFLNLGWEVSNAIDMNSVYSKVIPSSDVQRIEKLELFDEFEEWHLIQAHYCISMSVIENHRVQGLKNLEFLSATDG